MSSSLFQAKECEVKLFFVQKPNFDPKYKIIVIVCSDNVLTFNM